MDIIKNYYCNKKIYLSNKQAIDSKKSTISMKHYINRISSVSYEFTNFINRVVKYNSRGYSIYVGNTLITKKILNYLIYISTVSISRRWRRNEFHNGNTDMRVLHNFKSATIEIISMNADFDLECQMVKLNKHMVRTIICAGFMQKWSKTS
jgi:dTDP-4-dehydrorhamnose reductase